LQKEKVSVADSFSRIYQNSFSFCDKIDVKV